MRKSLLLLVAALFIASTAFAQVPNDNAPNNLGVYFDTDATIVCTSAPLYVPFNAYFILTNPTVASVKAFEVGVDLSGGTILALGFTTPVPSTVLGQPGAGMNDYNFLAGLSAPMPTSPVTLLGTWNILVNDATGTPTDISLDAAAPTSDTSATPRPMIQDGATLALIAVDTANEPGLPAAQINAPICTVVANEEASFGAVKALFR